VASAVARLRRAPEMRLRRIKRKLPRSRCARLPGQGFRSAAQPRTGMNNPGAGAAPTWDA